MHIKVVWTCLLLFLSSVSSNPVSGHISDCGEHGDCISSPDECNKKCGCDVYSAVLYYNETTKECDINVKLLLETLTEKYNTQESVISEANRVFNHIILSVIIFAACAGICVCSACFYCCHINYMDNRLKKDVDALAAKLKRENRYKKMPHRPAPPQSGESCNIIVDNAGVYCV
ncbi:uncharacterized protein LOC123701303 isoform X1 [Colias croceus]|uniref:uncharacterized protein LOC123701303 isoform X1 n=1 Tax=Colias crocea TaxID=72248 RepID=UPI001E27F280|nr:uncharacterized protein LOC123701303 isoform X1 [Colias croceus]